MTRRIGVIVLTLLVGAFALGQPAGLAQGQQGAVRFRGSVDVVRVDVVVRDREGKIVRGLTEADFQIVEDGKPRSVTTFDFEEILTAPSASAALDPAPAVLDRPTAAAGAPIAGTKRDIVDLPGRRLIVLFFDLSSMQPEDLDRAAASARKYIDDEMSAADLLAIASLSQALEVDQDFTADKEALHKVLDRFTGVEGTAETVAEDVEATEDPADLP